MKVFNTRIQRFFMLKYNGNIFSQMIKEIQNRNPTQLYKDKKCKKEGKHLPVGTTLRIKDALSQNSVAEEEGELNTQEKARSILKDV